MSESGAGAPVTGVIMAISMTQAAVDHVARYLEQRGHGKVYALASEPRAAPAWLMCWNLLIPRA